MLFLVVLGGAAVLEVHRALHNGPKDIREIKRKEEELRRQLQDLQRELRQAQSQRELTEREAEQLSELNQRLQHDKEELERQSSGLREANEELARQAEALQGRQQQLERSAESLQKENANLLQQFDRLKLRYEQESSAFHEQLAQLKQQVSGALQRFAAGELSAEGLLAFLSGMGVEVRCRPEDFQGLPDQLLAAQSAEERLQLLDKVELKVDDSWVHQLRLSSCPERAARLLMASRDAGPSGSAAAAALTYPQPQPKKLGTPPRDRDAAQAPKVPLLVLGAVGATASAPAEGPAAEYQPLPPAQQLQQQAPQLPPDAAAPAAAAPSAAGVLRPVQDNKSRSLRFLPQKKPATSKTRTPRLEVDLSIGENGGAPALSAGASGTGALGPLGGRALLGLGARGLHEEGHEELLGAGSRSLMSR